MNNNIVSDIVPMAFRADSSERGRKEPKATIIFPAPQYPTRGDSPAKRYRFSVDSGTVITPNMIAGSDAGAKGEHPLLERDTSTSTTTAPSTTTADTYTSSAIPPPRSIILGRILKPSSSVEITARPRFTLFVKDRLEKPIETSKILDGGSVTRTREPEEEATEAQQVTKKKRVTKVSQLKEALGYGEEDRRELWQLLGRRRRGAEERTGRGH